MQYCSARTSTTLDKYQLDPLRLHTLQQQVTCIGRLHLPDTILTTVQYSDRKFMLSRCQEVFPVPLRIYRISALSES